MRASIRLGQLIVKLCGNAKCRQRSIVTLTQRLKFPRANQVGFAVTTPSGGDDAWPDFCNVLRFDIEQSNLSRPHVPFVSTRAERIDIQGREIQI